MVPQIFRRSEGVYYGASECPECGRKELEGRNIQKNVL